jgi:hypothetical protein
VLTLVISFSCLNDDKHSHDTIKNAVNFNLFIFVLQKFTASFFMVYMVYPAHYQLHSICYTSAEACHVI